MFGKPMCGGRVILSAQRKGNMCVLKIPVWFCNETDTQRGRDREVEGGREGKGRRNVKLLHLTQDGSSLSLIHYTHSVDSAF